MSLSNVQVTCDLLRNTDLGLLNIDYVTRWWADLLAPVSQGAGFQTETITTVGQGGSFRTRDFVVACGLEPDSRAWEELFFATELPAAAERLLDESFQAAWVVGPMPPMLSNYLSRRGIPFLDLEHDQIRFGRDLFLRARTNDAQLAAYFERYSVPDTFVAREAGLLQARLGWHGPKIALSPARHVGIFAGQTEGDASMLTPMGMRYPADFVAETQKAFSGCDLILIVPHPYMQHTRNLDPIREALPQSCYCALNTYSLLRHPDVKVVVGLSSSVLAEALFFGKQVVQLMEYEHLNLRKFVPGASRNYRLSVDGFLRSWYQRLAGEPYPPATATGYTLRESWNLDYSLNLNATETLQELRPTGSLSFRHVWPTRVMSPSGFRRGDEAGFWTEGGAACLNLRAPQQGIATISVYSPEAQEVQLRCGASRPVATRLSAREEAALRCEVPAGVFDFGFVCTSPLAVAEIGFVPGTVAPKDARLGHLTQLDTAP